MTVAVSPEDQLPGFTVKDDDRVIMSPVQDRYPLDSNSLSRKHASISLAGCIILQYDVTVRGVIRYYRHAVLRHYGGDSRAFLAMLDIKESGRMAVEREKEKIPLILQIRAGSSLYAWGNVERSSWTAVVW